MPPTDPPSVVAADAITFIEVAMILFMVIFLAIVARVVLRRRGAYRDASRIPLDDRKIMTPREGPERSEADTESARPKGAEHE